MKNGEKKQKQAMCKGSVYRMALDFSTMVLEPDLHPRILYPTQLLIKCGFFSINTENFRRRSNVFKILEKKKSDLWCRVYIQQNNNPLEGLKTFS